MKNPIIVYNLIQWNPDVISCPSVKEYKIDTVRNSLLYSPGGIISEEQVQNLITKGYQINIRRPKQSDFKKENR
jgi:hypothetical protein